MRLISPQTGSGQVGFGLVEQALYSSVVTMAAIRSMKAAPGLSLRSGFLLIRDLIKLEEGSSPLATKMTAKVKSHRKSNAIFKKHVFN